MKAINRMAIMGMFFMVSNGLTFSQGLSEAIRLTVSSEGQSDQTAVRFLDQATDNFDSQLDAYKLSNMGSSPNFYTVSDENYSINALCTQFAEKSVELYLRPAFSGIYTISSEELGAFDSTWTILLVDKTLGVTYDLRTMVDYTFVADKNDAYARFTLVFKTNKYSTVTSTSSDYNLPAKERIYTSDDQILISFEEGDKEVVLAITDVSGHLLTSATQENLSGKSGSIWSFSPGKQGIYVVDLFVDRKHFSKSVFVAY